MGILDHDHLVAVLEAAGCDETAAGKITDMILKDVKASNEVHFRYGYADCLSEIEGLQRSMKLKLTEMITKETEGAKK